MKVLKGRLDPRTRVIAAQDFRHAAQEDEEKVCDFIHRLEHLFILAYGHESMSDETRSTLIYRQLQEGLKQKIMKAPAVSGATDYQALCIAAKAEERQLAELKKRRQCSSESKPGQTQGTQSDSGKKSQFVSTGSLPAKGKRSERKNQMLKCWNCDKIGHISSECKEAKKAARNMSGRGQGGSSKLRTQQVYSSETADAHETNSSSKM